MPPSMIGSVNWSFEGEICRSSSVQAARSYANMEVVQPAPSQRRWFSNRANEKRMPSALVLLSERSTPLATALFLRRAESFAAIAFASRIALVVDDMEPIGRDFEGVSSRPVISDRLRRIVRERHSIVREIRAGRECHVRPMLPRTSMIRLVVIIYNGGSVSRNQKGVNSISRINSVISAGLVVAEVAVRCVERKSVSRIRGSRRILQREVKRLMVSTISSRDL